MWKTEGLFSHPPRFFLSVPLFSKHCMWALLHKDREDMWNESNRSRNIPLAPDTQSRLNKLWINSAVELRNRLILMPYHWQFDQTTHSSSSSIFFCSSTVLINNTVWGLFWNHSACYIRQWIFHAIKKEPGENTDAVLLKALSRSAGTLICCNEMQHNHEKGQDWHSTNK